jgi:hypothetical protein
MWLEDQLAKRPTDQLTDQPADRLKDGPTDRLAAGQSSFSLVRYGADQNCTVYISELLVHDKKGLIASHTNDYNYLC